MPSTSAAARSPASPPAGTTQAIELGVEARGALRGERGGDPQPLGVELPGVAEPDDEHPAGASRVQHGELLEAGP